MTFFFSSRRRHTRWPRDWSSDVCSSDLEACDKLMLPERIGRKEYCSPKCCAMDHRPAHKENKDYMWLYRLSKIKSGGTLRRRLKGDPDAMKRLRQIETRWKDEPKFTEKTKEIRARVRI